MGILFSKKNSTIEVLEKLENEIKEIEESKGYAQTSCTKITGNLYVYYLAGSITCGVIFYFQYPSTFKEKLAYFIVLALMSLLLLLSNKIISWYYGKQIKVAQSRLMEMKKEKKRILDEVMDKETYKVAKEILEKFSNDMSKPNELRKRIPDVSSSVNTLHQRSIIKSSPDMQHNKPTNLAPKMITPGPVMRLPAPILPQQRSYFDRMIEYLVGDGPNNRFALICSRCHSHNGMALKEEFEYISFKCCYCFFLNPARKIRPEAPKLEETQISEIKNGISHLDSSRESSDDDSREITDGNINVDNKGNEESVPQEINSNPTNVEESQG